MAEYYSVIRHSADGVGVKRGPYKNAKYIARVARPTGKFRYIYNPDELAAYKGAKSNATGNSKSAAGKKSGSGKNSGKTTVTKGPTAVSAGALTYRGENDPNLAALAPEPQDPLAKKKKKKKSKVTATFTRIR